MSQSPGLAPANGGDNARPKVALVYIDSGGGHRASARALSEVMRRQQPSWEVELHCLQDLLDPIDYIRKWTGVPFQDLYNIMLRRGWTLGTAQLTPLAHLIIRLCHKAQVRALAEYWSACRPDIVVALIPHYNRALKEALEAARPGAPFVTVLTDIADYPPHFWIERQDQHRTGQGSKAASFGNNMATLCKKARTDSQPEGYLDPGSMAAGPTNRLPPR